jgi:Ser/Thr protein kinase RdoA (MazF antagonist)
MIPIVIMVQGDRRDDPAGAVPHAATVSSQWDLDAGSLKLWRYSANFVYTLTIDGVPHFLRVAPGSERTPDRLAREVALLDWLHAQGWRVPVAVPARDGSRVATETVEVQTYLAVMWPVVPGSLREIDELSLEDLATWGATLGQLHVALRRVPAALGPQRVAWHTEHDLIVNALPDWPSAVQDAARQSLDRIASRPTAGDDYGLIHGDFELDNLLWTEEGLGVIDFDEAGVSWAAADIAFAVRDLIDAGETLASPRLAAFLAGYATARPLPTELSAELPPFSQWASLVSLARITRALAADASHLPDWATNLNQRLAKLGATYQDNILSAAASLTSD